MTSDAFELLRAQLRGIKTAQAVGQITALGRDCVSVAGLDRVAALGDRVRLGGDVTGEILGIEAGRARVMPEGPADGLDSGRP